MQRNDCGQPLEIREQRLADRLGLHVLLAAEHDAVSDCGRRRKRAKSRLDRIERGREIGSMRDCDVAVIDETLGRRLALCIVRRVLERR